MLDGPNVTIIPRSSVSKHLDGVHVSGDILRKKLCSAQLPITISVCCPDEY